MGKSYREKGSSQFLRVKVRRTIFRLDAKTIRRRKDVGLPGRGPRIIPIEKGKFSKYGYSIKKSERARREALKKAAEAYGALSTWRKLNAMVIVRKRTQPEAWAIFEADANWIRETTR